MARTRLIVALGALATLSMGCGASGPVATPTPGPSLAPAAHVASMSPATPPMAAPPSRVPAPSRPPGPSGTPTPPTPPTPEPSPTPPPAFDADVPFTPPIPCAADRSRRDAICQLQFDIAAPAVGTGVHPIAVLLRGGPDKPHAADYLATPAKALAARGIVAMVADWRESADFAGGGRTSLRDVACAIGVARRVGAAYGGDPSRVTLIGHSLGGWSGGLVSLSPRSFTPARAECDSTSGSLRPEAFVSIEGWVPDEVSDVAPTRPASPLPILVIQTEADRTVRASVARHFAAVLRDRGYAPRLIVLPGGDHGSALRDASVLDTIADFAGTR